MESLMPVPASAQLVYAPHPLVAAGRKTVSAPPNPGETVRAFVLRMGVPIDKQPCFIGVNGALLSAPEQARNVVRPGDVLAVRAAMQDGGEGDSDPFVVILSIVLLVVTAGIANVYWRAIVTVVGGIIINKLTAQHLHDLSGEADSAAKDSPTYSVSGGRNRARPGQPMPIVFGTHKIVPDLAAQPYTTFTNLVLQYLTNNYDSWPFTDDQVSGQQTLFQIFHFGLSDITLSDFKIGLSPIEGFSGYFLEEADATGAIASVPGNVDTTAVNVPMTVAAGWVQRTTPANTTRFDVDIAGTLYQINQANGRIENHEIIFELEYRAQGDVTWLPYSFMNPNVVCLGGRASVTFRGTASQTFTMPSDVYEVRLRRITADDGPTGTAVSQLSWTSLRSYQTDTTNYALQKRVGLVIYVGEQLSGVIEDFNAIAVAQQRIPQVGGGTVTAATSNPAWCFYNFARGRFSAAGRLLWGMGLPESRLDMDSLFDWADFCDSSDLRCDLVIDRQMTAFDVLRIMCACGRGAPTFASGRLGVVWDAANQPVTGLYGMSNIIAGSFSVDYISEELADELVGVFMNADENYLLDEVSVLKPGVTSPVRSQRVELMGITRESQAARAVNLMMAANEYHRRRITWDTDLAGMVNTRGDVVALSHDLTSWGYSGRLLAGTDTSLTLDRAVPFTPGEDHWLMLVEPNGAYSFHEITLQVGEATVIAPVNDLSTVLNSEGNAVTPPNAHPTNIAADYRFAFAPEATPGKLVKIEDIKPIDAHRLRITARDETPDYYAAENGTYQHTTPPDFIARNPTVSDITFGEQLITRDGLTRVTVSWSLSGTDSVLLTLALDTDVSMRSQRVQGGSYSFDAPSGTLVKVAVRPFVLAATQQTATINATYTVLGKFATPNTVTGFQAVVDGPYILLSWDRNTEIDIAGYDLRRGGTNFDDATPVDFIAQPSTQYRHSPTQAGITTFKIKSLDLSDLYSVDASTINFNVEAPGAPGSVDVQVIDNNTVLNWTASVSGTFGVAFYKVHVGSDIENPDQVYQVDGRFANIQHLEAGQYTYHIFAVDIAGIEGAARTVTATVTAPPDFVLTLDQDSAFGGTLTNMILDTAGVLQFPFASGRQLVTQYTTNSWANWLDKVSAGYTRHFQPSETSASYEEIIDLGAVVGNNRIIVTPTWEVLAGDVTLEITLSVRDDPGDPWTVFTAGDTDVFASAFRYIRIQMAATAAGADDAAQMTRLNLRIQAKILTDTGKGISNAGDATGTLVTFNTPFADVTNIAVTPYTGTTRTSVVVNFTDAPNPTEFRVLLFDEATGTRVTASFGWSAQGY